MKTLLQTILFKYNVKYILISVIIGIFTIQFFNLKTKNVLQSTPLVVNTYNDNFSNGKSMCNAWFSEDSSRVLYSTILQKGAMYPYAGMNFVLGSKFNIETLDEVMVLLSLEKKGNIYINLNCKTDDNKTYTLSNKLECNKGMNEFSIKLNNFETPDWWSNIENIPDSIINSPPKLIEVISFSHNELGEIGKKETIEINGLTFKASNIHLKILLYITLFVNITFILILNLFKKDDVKVVLEYQSVDTSEIKNIDLENKNLNDIVEFINKNYQNSELTRKLVRKNIKVTENNISELLIKHFDKGFSDYVNDIRLEEAKRLLVSTDYKINEIADLTGFGSVSSFNRIFKQKQGTSPTSFRASE